VAGAILGAAATAGSAVAITAAVRESRKTLRMTDHDQIREWIEQRGGSPAAAGAPGSGRSNVLVIHFPDTGETDVQQVSWDDFFRHFDDQNLALVCEIEDVDDPRDDTSRDFEFVLR
jgi:hypothetical protein